MVVAVDGPAGAGKSSIAKIIANKLSLEYVDSGAIYRSVTKKILDSGIKIDNYTRTQHIIDAVMLDMRDGHVYIDGVDFSAFIRDKEVTENVSVIAKDLAVRARVTAFLNEYAKGKSIIMDGRDIGTAVFPDAEYKFYLDASVEERAQRRFKEANFDASLEEIRRSIERRDYSDMHREFGALKKADDAIYIDTTTLSVDQVVEKIINCIK